MPLDADPTRATMIIVAIFSAATVRCGWHSGRLCEARVSMMKLERIENLATIFCSGGRVIMKPVAYRLP